ncbi:adenylate/guanylate cyclase domain-containing protein [Fulvivirga sedimenti]|uniref:Adenylate/guanylate cyclase domain-containing protein n=1 Tax=Fulvivirga sedimenti TaxID=2879465 RepID=A0A9X1L2T8_9BACT|nr:adenylate/guanylate cyclase domain-containing protein [Fulvivirga sedimenti]MCA6078541.1 adenylate/guanylate cyclase domain-containing protein [Fulvivirga sedimenti]
MFRLSALKRRSLKKVIPFALATAFFAFLFAIIEKGLMGSSTIYPATGNPYDFASAIAASVSGGFLMGIVLAISEVLFLDSLFERTTFFMKVVVKGALYILLICIMLFLVALFLNASQMDQPVYNAAVIYSVLNFMFSFAFVSIVIYAGACVTIILLISEISDNLGQSVLLNYMTGKYHRPKQEERIFMFLDMRSSTSIAENLGHIRYFDFLNEYYGDLTEYILKSGGEIYQYVGDEVIISWPSAEGFGYLKSIQCFFDIREGMKAKEARYAERYDAIPGFKAGIHSGKVTTGEIGLIKKEIVFTGDVLNTAARIQASCNTYGVDLLVSGRIKNFVEPQNELRFEAMGNISLRGKTESVELFSVAKEEI